jgi:pyruvate/2-oxoglutarate dehydrogenase complex dihydrolipoamide acyltransferase (E2) component
LSFTGYLAFCLARAIDEDKSVQAYRKGRSQLALFEDVDVGLMIERQMGDSRVPVGYVIRRANHKTFMEIHEEIRAVQAAPAPPNQKPPLVLRLLKPLPKLANSLVHAAIRRDPAGTWVAMAGTVGLSSVGMFGKGSGWPLAAPAGHPLCVYVGGIGRKPACVSDRIEPREFLSLTIAFDHDVVDGAPAARFTQRFKELIESGYGLADDSTTPAPGVVAEAESIAFGR